MNIVLIVPTGIGAAIGGHAGDANPVCKLLASQVDILITHPNVVNASDINEMPDNVWYVEGSMLDRFLEGGIQLKRPLQNRILVATNAPVSNDTINAVSAARVTIGIEAEILELSSPLRMEPFMSSSPTRHRIEGYKELFEDLSTKVFDALAIHTPIEIPREMQLRYYREGGRNPWGQIEAQLSKVVGNALNKPVAHAPKENVLVEDTELYNILFEKVDPRIAPEVISYCYLHSVLKGLNRAPRISRTGLSVEDIDVMVSPTNCYGRPHKACEGAGVPIIYVDENTTLNEAVDLKESTIHVANYWEAAGLIQCMKAGISGSSVRRPIEETKVL